MQLEILFVQSIAHTPHTYSLRPMKSEGDSFGSLAPWPEPWLLIEKRNALLVNLRLLNAFDCVKSALLAFMCAILLRK